MQHPINPANTRCAQQGFKMQFRLQYENFALILKSRSISWLKHGSPNSKAFPMRLFLAERHILNQWCRDRNVGRPSVTGKRNLMTTEKRSLDCSRWYLQESTIHGCH